MQTLRRYLRLADAYPVKTLLDDYGVFCSLFDENSHLNIGSYFAVPVRLVAADNQLQRAARILAVAERSPIPEDALAAADDQFAVRLLDEDIFGEHPVDEDHTVELPANKNPWEIPAIAYLFAVPGIGFILEQLPLILFIGGRRRNRFLVLSPLSLHLIGAALICVALLLTGGYFYTRKAVARDIDRANELK